MSLAAGTLAAEWFMKVELIVFIGVYVHSSMWKFFPVSYSVYENFVRRISLFPVLYSLTDYCVELSVPQ